MLRARVAERTAVTQGSGRPAPGPGSPALTRGEDLRKSSAGRMVNEQHGASSVAKPTPASAGSLLLEANMTDLPHPAISWCRGLVWLAYGASAVSISARESTQARAGVCRIGAPWL